MAITRPTSVRPWADTGDKTTPTDGQLASGYASVLPPSRGITNWLLNWCMNGVRYLDEHAGDWLYGDGHDGDFTAPSGLHALDADYPEFHFATMTLPTACYAHNPLGAIIRVRDTLTIVGWGAIYRSGANAVGDAHVDDGAPNGWTYGGGSGGDGGGGNAAGADGVNPGIATGLAAMMGGTGGHGGGDGGSYAGGDGGARTRDIDAFYQGRPFLPSGYSHVIESGAPVTLGLAGGAGGGGGGSGNLSVGGAGGQGGGLLLIFARKIVVDAPTSSPRIAFVDGGNGGDGVAPSTAAGGGGGGSGGGLVIVCEEFVGSAGDLDDYVTAAGNAAGGIGGAAAGSGGVPGETAGDGYVFLCVGDTWL